MGVYDNPLVTLKYEWKIIYELSFGTMLLELGDVQRSKQVVHVMTGCVMKKVSDKTLATVETKGIRVFHVAPCRLT